VECDSNGNWQRELQQVFQNDPRCSVGLRGIRDLRTAPAVMAVQLLENEQPFKNASEIRAVSAAVTGQDPNTVVRLAQEIGASFVLARIHIRRNLRSDLQSTVAGEKGWQSLPVAH